MKNGLKAGLIYTGVVIGAGFASGKELWQFFGRFGSLGLVGLFVAFILYFGLGCAVFYIIGEGEAENVFEIFGGFLGKAVTLLNFGFMFALFVSMTAAAGSFAAELLGLKEILGSLIFCLLIYLGACFGEEGFLNVNVILTPLLWFFGAAVGLKAYPFFKLSGIEGKGSVFGAVLSGVIYVSYNILSLTAVMFPFKAWFRNRKTRLWGSFSGSLFMFILGVCLFSPIVVYYKQAENFPLPMLKIAAEGGGALYGIYVGVLFAAVFTTAIGNFYGFKEALKGRLSGVIILLAGLLCSLGGFSNIISVIYPLFGILGLLNIALIVYNYIKYRFYKN